MKFTIIVAIAIGLMLWGLWSAIQYEENHPCIQWQEYCYYETHDTAVGVGPAIGGSGGMAVTVAPTTAKIYVDCNIDHALIPGHIYSENKCVVRK